jgi:glycosyltransferase involved in cell wall biosynthesis
MSSAAILINSLGGGGSERAVSTLAQALAARGFPFLLICLERRVSYELPPGCRLEFLSRSTGREPGLAKLLLLPLYALRLKVLVHSLGIRTVQSHLYRANFVNLLARLLGSRHRAQIVNGGQASYYQTKGLAGAVNLSLLRWLYPRADLLVAKSAGMRDDLQSLLRRAPPMRVIHNPYDLERVRAAAGQALREDWFPDGTRTLVSVGRLVPLKRQEDILEAFAAVAREQARLQLLFLGDGPERERLARLAVRRGLGGRVLFAGHVANPFQYLARSSCLVSASASEGFPNVLVEAMICGCPVVSSDCQSGPREILAPDTDYRRRLEAGYELAQAGILFAVGDVRALQEALSLLLSDARLAEQLGLAGRRRCQDFGEGAVCAEYQALLDG